MSSAENFPSVLSIKDIKVGIWNTQVLLTFGSFTIGI